MHVYTHVEDALRDPSARVLIHCVAGISRSVSILTAFFMYKRSLSAFEAFDLVHSLRYCAFPNAGFLNQLLCLEGYCHDYGVGPQPIRLM